MNKWSRRVLAMAAACGGLWLAGPVAAQLPYTRLHSIDPLGGQAGQRIEIRVAVDDLDLAERMVFSHPGITAQPVTEPANRFYPEPRALDGRFDVTIDSDVPAGVYEARVIGAFGVSNARRFEVGVRPQIPEIEPNNTLEQAQTIELNTVISGRCDAGDFDSYRFTAPAYRTVVIHAAAERLNSEARVALRVIDANGVEVARTRPIPGGDAVITFSPSNAGEYIVRAYDSTFDGGARRGYRLCISDGPWVHFVDPPILTSPERSVAVYGFNLPGTGRAEFDGRVLDRLEQPNSPGDATGGDELRRPGSVGVGRGSLRVTTGQGVSNPFPLLAGPETLRPAVIRTDPSQPFHIEAPSEVVGRFDASVADAWFGFEATKGQSLAIELYCDRLGQPTDPLLVVQSVPADADADAHGGTDLAQADDVAPATSDKNSHLYRYPIDHADPALLFTAPHDGRYRLLVRDQFSAASLGMPTVFHLSLRPAEADYRLVAWPYQSPLVPLPNMIEMAPRTTVLRRGGTQAYHINVIRSPGFSGDVTVAAEQLPEGVTADPIVIPSWRAHGVLPVHASADAQPRAGNIRIVGRASGGDGSDVVRHAESAELLDEVSRNLPVRAQLVADAALSINAEDAAVALSIDLPEDTRIARGGKLEIPVRLNKPGQMKGDLNLAPVDHHPSVKIALGPLSADQSSQTMTIEPSADSPLGRFSFFLNGVATIVYQRNLPAVRRAEADKERITLLYHESAQALSAAISAREAADQPSDQTAEAEQRARAEFEQAEKSLKRAESELERANRFATAIDVKVPILSRAVTVQVVAPPEPAAALQ